MKRHELDHLIRSAGAVTGSTDILVIGSQAVLPQLRQSAETVNRSNEADLSAMPGIENTERIADLIDGVLGEGSYFNDTFGYYGQGVEPTTARLPTGWEDRMVRYENANTHGVVAWMPEKHDIAVAKLIAGREKDIEFVTELVQLGELTTQMLNDRIGQVSDLEPEVRDLTMARVRRISREVTHPCSGPSLD